MIEPAVVVKPRDVPAHVVLCYFQDVIERVVHEHGGRQVARLRSEIGDNVIYEIDYGGRRLAIVHPGVGAPLAAAFLEELIALVLTGASVLSWRYARNISRGMPG